MFRPLSTATRRYTGNPFFAALNALARGSTWLLLAGIWTTPAAALPDVEVFVVGANVSYDPHLKPLKFAELDAQRFADAMATVGLVPKLRSNVLAGPSVLEFRQAIDNLIRSEAHEAKADADARKFIFYFSGHSDESGLHLKDGRISKQELHEALGNIHAHTKIAVLDSCFSGAISAKGVVDAPAFELPRMEFDEPTGSVFLTASSAHQPAYESDDLGSSIFTHHLLQGLYGEADANSDGVVTVDELYQYVYRNTKWQSLNYPTKTAQEPEYVAKLQGQGAIVLSFPAKTNSKLTVGPDIHGEITIASPQSIQFFKVVKTDNLEKTLQLPVGSYRFSVRDESKIGEGLAKVDPARVTYITRSDLQWHDANEPTPAAAKGVEVPTSGSDITASAPQPNSEFAFGLLMGAHSGYVKDGHAGPFVEVNLARVFAQVSRLNFTWGGALNFHENAASTGNEKVTTDSSAAFLTTGIQFVPARIALPVLSFDLGLGQGYHNQVLDLDGVKQTHGGLVPGAYAGINLAARVANGHRTGIALRVESMDTSRVSDSAAATGTVAALTMTF